MRHSIEVEEKHYGLTQSLEQAAGAYDVVHNRPTAENKIIKKMFTDMETQAIEEHFAEDLEAGNAISVSKSKQFCALNPCMDTSFFNTSHEVSPV